MLVAIVQARAGSSRLPGKVLMQLGARSVLGWVVDRVRAARRLDKVAIAIPVGPGDDALHEHALSLGVGVVRGDEADVLGRYLLAAERFGATDIVRITSDCPLFDPEILDRMIERYRAERPDYLSNALPTRKLPRGLDAEIFTAAALARADREARAPHQREHVTPYFYENADLFRLAGFDPGFDAADLRWTLDTPEDHALISRLFALLADRPDFRTRDVLALYERNPELRRINAGVRQKELGA